GRGPGPAAPAGGEARGRRWVPDDPRPQPPDSGRKPPRGDRATRRAGPAGHREAQAEAGDPADGGVPETPVGGQAPPRGDQAGEAVSGPKRGITGLLPVATSRCPGLLT